MRESNLCGMNRRPVGHYGIDAPWVPWMFVGIGVVYLALAACLLWLWNGTAIGVVVLAIVGVVMLVAAAVYWHTTLRGKFVVWHDLLSTLPAPARVLDLGCGRGAVSIMTALRFGSARVDGIDLWRSIDQSGNGPGAAAANAAVNGVSDRIVFTTADMTEVPFADDTFDLVTGSVAIHNIPTASGRARAVDEAWRVLASGGRLVVADISKTREYVTRLRERGATDVTVHPAGWRMWWSGPWMATTVVQATKH